MGHGFKNSRIQQKWRAPRPPRNAPQTPARTLSGSDPATSPLCGIEPAAGSPGTADACKVTAPFRRLCDPTPDTHGHRRAHPCQNDNPPAWYWWARRPASGRVGQSSRLALVLVGQASRLAPRRSPGRYQSRRAGPGPAGQQHPNKGRLAPPSRPLTPGSPPLILLAPMERGTAAQPGRSHYPDRFGPCFRTPSVAERRRPRPPGRTRRGERKPPRRRAQSAPSVAFP